MPDPIRLSWSRLKTYEVCKHRSLRQQQGKSISGKVNGRNFLPGTIADRAMRSWLESPNPQPGGMLEYVEGLFEEHTGPDAEYVIKWKGNPREDMKAVIDQVRECLTNLEPVLMQRVIPFRYQPELRFKTNIAVPYLDGTPVSIELVGGIDIAVQDDDGNFELMDLKNTRDDGYAATMLGQLVFYGLAWGAYMGDKTQPAKSSFLTPLCRERYVPVVMNPDIRRQMASRIVAYCHGVWRQEWTPNTDDKACWDCDVKHVCDRYALPSVKDEQGKNRVSFAQLAQTRREIRRENAARSAVAAVEGESARGAVPPGAVVGEAGSR